LSISAGKTSRLVGSFYRAAKLNSCQQAMQLRSIYAPVVSAFKSELSRQWSTSLWTYCVSIDIFALAVWKQILRVWF